MEFYFFPGLLGNGIIEMQKQKVLKGSHRTALSGTFNFPLWGQGSLASCLTFPGLGVEAVGAERPFCQSTGWAAPTHITFLLPHTVRASRGTLWHRADHSCTRITHPYEWAFGQARDRYQAENFLSTLSLLEPRQGPCLQTSKYPICLHEFNPKCYKTVHVALTLERNFSWYLD